MNSVKFVLFASAIASVLGSTALIPAVAQVPGNYPMTPGAGVPSRPAPTGGTPVPGNGIPGGAPNMRPPMPGAGIAAPGAAVPGTMPQNSPVANSTTFLCGQSGNNPATLVQVGGRTLQSPLIVWTTNYFGANYTPQQRCQIVSTRLSNAVAQNGGRLSNLRLATGLVNRETVVCVTNASATCSSNNMLFTLRPENANNPQDVLARLMQFGRLGSGNAVYESGGLGGTSTDSSIDLEEAVNLAVQEESGSVTPGYPTGPVYDPYATQGGVTPNPGYAPDPVYSPDPGAADPNYYPGGI